jgi:hypothetical protein
MHKKSYSVGNGSVRETNGSRDFPKSVSVSHGNLCTTNQNSSSSDHFVPLGEEFVAVNRAFRSVTPKESNRKEQVSPESQKDDFLNSFHRYSLPPCTFARASSMDQIHRCGVSETLTQKSTDCRVDTTAPALPPRPPKPARFGRDERRRSQQLQETVPWVRIRIDLPHLINHLHVQSVFE